MKFIKSQTKNKFSSDKKIGQTTGSDVFIRKIYSKRRGYKKSKVVVRKYQKLMKWVFILTVVVVAVIYGSSALNVKDFLSIGEIEIVGANNFVNETDLRELAENNSLGSFILSFNTGKLELVLEKNFLGARNIDVEKEYPGKLKVIVEERVPLAIVKSTKDNQKYLMDDTGYILGVVNNSFSELPVVSYSEDVFVGASLDSSIVPVSAEILRLAESEEVSITSMSFHPKYVRFYTGTGTDVYIGENKDIGESMSAIGTLLKKLILEGKHVTKIDLRYDKVIVLYD